MTDERQALLALEKQLRALDRATRFNQLGSYKPYPKQMKFHNDSEAFRERLLMAANRVGKSYCGAAEMAMHLTGRYPAWWKGRKFDRPIKAWAASDTGLTVRDVVQTKLCGPYGVTDLQGAGAIPHDCVNWERDVSLARGVTDLYDTVLVTHETNGIVDGKSILTFKTYEQGRKKWQGDAVDVIWCDEEPEWDVYGEALARIAPTRGDEPGGIIYTTFTPLLGRSTVVIRFTDPSPEDITSGAAADRVMVSMTLDDAQHINAEARKKIMAGYTANERDARAKGIPMMGEGRIFTMADEVLMVSPFEIPREWALLWGTDFGLQHPFGAALLAHDRDNDVIYVTRVVRMSDALPLQHCAAMKTSFNNHGHLIPMAWPQDGHQRENLNGKLEPLSKVYKFHGQRVCETHAQFADGTNGTEVGIALMEERILSARLKVFSTCSEWFDEFHFYHRKEGLIVKIRDDLMSATRVGVMAIRMSRPVLFHPNTQSGRAPVVMARDLDNDPFAR
jgi:phage terminase large subunit-like protein